jgi:putative oxidoreductase
MFAKKPRHLLAHPLLGGEELGVSLWPDFGLLILRVYAGVVMSGAGMDKIPVGNWFTDQVAGIGFPLPRFFAFAAAFSEFAGGWLLVLGLLSRPAAFFMAVTMGVASWTIHADVAFWGLHIARIYFWVYVCLTFTGAGRFSLDHLYRLKRGQTVVVAISLLVLVGIGGYQELFVAPLAQSDVGASLDEVQAISLAGSFNDWTLDATPMVKGEDGTWRATVEIEKSGPIEFKFAANKDWSLNAGATADAKSSFPLAGDGRINSDGEPENIKAYIPAVGLYEFTFNLESFAYTLDRAEIKASETPTPPVE